MIVPQVEVAGRAPVPIVLVVVGLQLFIHVKGQPLKALAPYSSDDNTHIMLSF